VVPDDCLGGALDALKSRGLLARVQTLSVKADGSADVVFYPPHVAVANDDATSEDEQAAQRDYMQFGAG
jgi:hypothetical protein